VDGGHGGVVERCCEREEEAGAFYRPCKRPAVTAG
jgi:hypothetical protein